MLKLVLVVLAVLAVASAQVLLYPGAYTSAVESQGTIQAHSPWAVSSSSRVQVHGSPLLGLSAAYAYY